jgi:predicted nucleotidyltransferase
MKDYRRIAEDFARHLKAKYGDRIERIILFGSVARGDYREDSDIDLIVVTLGDWFALQGEIAGDAVDWLLRTGVYLSTKVFSSDDFARSRETGFGQDVALEGVPLA